MEISTKIINAETSLGIELGSTRIKAVLTDNLGKVLATGCYEWENQLIDGIWTYSLDEVHKGLHSCYKDLAKNVKDKCGVTLSKIGTIGISAMMHGYLVFDKNNKLLTPFRTWRNTMTKQAVDILSKLFRFNIPQRWSIAHLYQSILNKEEHVKDIAYMTTLSGYVHWLLTGEKVLGINDASGMFPIDKDSNFHKDMMKQFDNLIEKENYSWKLSEILPKVLKAGCCAGTLTEKGAVLLDETGVLQPGIPLCPPEGDAGTGMVATNSIAKKTGNVSAGTSIFAMIVLEKELKGLYPEIDMVTTPDGSPVAMVHCNNCTSDLNSCVNLFDEVFNAFEINIDKGKLYTTLYKKALDGDKSCTGLMAYNYLSGEHITGVSEGRPLFVRTPDTKMTLANFMRTHIYATLGSLRIGLDILTENENVKIDKIMGHGGFFKTPEVGQKILAAALNTDVSVMETAGEGGAWGISLLASFMKWKDEKETLPEFLNNKIFVEENAVTVSPDKEDVTGFNEFMKEYKSCLAIEKCAIENLK